MSYSAEDGEPPSAAELKALFSSIANQLSISEADVDKVISKMNGAGVTVAILSDGSIDNSALYQHGIHEVEDATLILTAAQDLTKRGVNDFQGEEGRPPTKPLSALKQSSDSFDGLAGNEPPDIRSLSVLLASVYNWENLGVKLGITMQKLKEIKQQYHDDLEMCKNQLYDMWLRQTTEPSWRVIVDALEQIEENSLADKIRRRLFLQPDCDIGFRSSPVRQFSVYDSPIPRSFSVGSKPGHDPVPSVVMIPVAVTLASTVSPHPIPCLANIPRASTLPTILPAVVSSASVPMASTRSPAVPSPSPNALHQATLR